MTSFFGIKVCVFLENDKTDRAKFFSGFRRKLFIITCIEKQCTRPLRIEYISQNTYIYEQSINNNLQLYTYSASEPLKVMFTVPLASDAQMMGM